MYGEGFVTRSDWYSASGEVVTGNSNRCESTT